MISGVFQFATGEVGGEAELFCSAAGFTECAKGDAVQHEELENGSVKHVFSNSLPLGMALGSRNMRTAFSSHLNCTGQGCACAQFVSNFVTGDQIYRWSHSAVYKSFSKKLKFTESQILRGIEELLLEDRIAPPFTAVLLCSSFTVAAYYLRCGEARIVALSPGKFFFDKGVISKIPGPCSMLERLQDTIVLPIADFGRIASVVVHELCDGAKYWPKPHGFGAALVTAGRAQTQLQVVAPASPLLDGDALHPHLLLAADSKRKKKPKGVITAFNYFSMMERGVVSAQSPERATNEVNALLGRLWKSMTKAQRAPYQQHADADRQRYDEEMQAYRAERARAGPGDTDQSGRNARVLTAYNHFLQQERQFIMSMGLSDAQKGVGRHGGLRWAAMEKEERELYVTLNAVDEATHDR